VLQAAIWIKIANDKISIENLNVNINGFEEILHEFQSKGWIDF